ncbi:hypothetical protein JCGZ_12668 [Jatropha curcas]|uniref:Uncharacterized protein n=1 Tax=Jatropha curcas TaxID=180498 RepID=A0A067KPV5_JATCU|nr:hypothetical protein JCGZ_12668 [Jatropha curcas]
MVELERLRWEYQAQAKKIKLLQGQNQELGDELKELRDQEGLVEEDLAQACLSLRTKIIAELKVRELEKDWSWVNQVYPDDEEEGDIEEAASDPLLQDPNTNGLPSL